jgi:(p)ppGpp synthase/HD superfamily hydrolase
VTPNDPEPPSPSATPAAVLASDEHDLSEATRLAWEWHGRQTRKGRSTSYMSHLLQVQGLVIEHGGTAEQATAALLHDALEDAESPAQRGERETTIHTRFGLAVLRIVLDCTDTTPAEAGQNKGPWRERKERYIAQLDAADHRSLLVAACDKRHNLSDLISDLRQEGLHTFARFNAGPDEQLWYFESLEARFSKRIPTRLASEITTLLVELRAGVEATREAGDGE